MSIFKRKKHRNHSQDLNEIFEQALSAAEEAGADTEEVARKIVEAFEGVIDESAPAVVQSLEKRAPRMLREHRKINRRFTRNIRRRWRDPLDRYYSVLVSAVEAGEDFVRRNEEEVRENGDLVYEAVVGLHTQACRVAWEVHSLLQSGFPYGALARCRTLHELTVIIIVLTEHGRDSNNSGLAERFFEHGSVMQYKEVKEYQETCENLGNESFSDEEVEEYKAEHDRLMAKYGPQFKQEFGWAVGLVANPNFRELEKLAEISHLRTHYKWSSKEIHAGARGWAQNLVEFRGGLVRLAGPTNNFLADPGQMAAISLNQATVALLIAGVEDAPDPMDLLTMKSMGILVGRCCDSFAKTQEKLDADEEKIRKERGLE